MTPDEIREVCRTARAIGRRQKVDRLTSRLVEELENMDPEERSLFKRDVLRAFAKAEGKSLSRYDEDRDNLRVILGGKL